mmetsp:Transcript_1242/g.1572  ORF Transcript_1242/g.1572 Transcript_1242/m.1572 type:complete len:236 (+) Transcript_1242:442-1149(+)
MALLIRNGTNMVVLSSSLNRTPTGVSNQRLNNVTIIGAILFCLHKFIQFLLRSNCINPLASVSVRDFNNSMSTETGNIQRNFCPRYVSNRFWSTDTNSYFFCLKCSVVKIISFSSKSFVATTSQASIQRVDNGGLGFAHKDSVPWFLSDITERSTDRNPFSFLGSDFQNSLVVEPSWRIWIILIPFYEVYFFIINISQGICITRSFHNILVIQNSQTTLWEILFRQVRFHSLTHQ